MTKVIGTVTQQNPNSSIPNIPSNDVPVGTVGGSVFVATVVWYLVKKGIDFAEKWYTKNIKKEETQQEKEDRIIDQTLENKEKLLSQILEQQNKYVSDSIQRTDELLASIAKSQQNLANLLPVMAENIKVNAANNAKNTAEIKAVLSTLNDSTNSSLVKGLSTQAQLYADTGRMVAEIKMMLTQHSGMIRAIHERLDRFVPTTHEKHRQMDG
jgi:hypothetical protein